MKKRQEIQLCVLLISIIFVNSIYSDGDFNTITTIDIDQNSEGFSRDIVAPLSYITFGTSGYEVGNGVVVGSNDTIYLAGSRLVKYNKYGVQLWNISSGGNGVAIDSFDNIYLTGRRYGPGNADVYLTKVNSSGGIEWSITWVSTVRESWDEGEAIAIDSIGNIYVTGRAPGPGSTIDAFLAKFDSNGNLLWDRLWGGADNDIGHGIAVDSANNVYFGGFTYSYDYRGDMFLVKYDSYGNKLWDLTHGGAYYDNGYGVAVDSNDNVYHVGYTKRSSGTRYMRLTKFNTQGAKQWHRDWGANSVGRGVGIDKDDNVYATGIRSGASEDILLVKYDVNGNKLGQISWGGAYAERVLQTNCIDFDSSNNIYLGGTTESYGAGSGDMLLLKFDGCKPYVNILNPIVNGIVGPTAPFFIVEIDDANLEQMWYSLNGGSAQFFTNNETFRQDLWDLLPNGTLTISFYANDTVGNIGSSSIQLNIDKLSPNITINNPLPNQLFDNRTFNFDLSIEEGNLDSTWYTINGGLNYEFSSTSGIIDQAAWDLCGNGTNIIRFYANDSLGNIAYKEVGVQKDIHLPIITILNPSLNQLFGNQTIDYELDVLGNDIDYMWYTLNDGTNHFFNETTGTLDQVVWGNCGNGSVTIKFYVNNSASNIASVEVSVYRDIFPPNLTILHPSAGQIFGNNTFAFELSLLEANLDKTWYSLNGGPNYEFSGLSGNINQAAWDLCGNGTNIVRFYANDTLGNKAVEELIINKDFSLPTISIINPNLNQLFGNETISYELNVLGSDIDYMWYTLNDGVNHFFNETTGTLDQVAWDNCGNGSISIKFYANNTAGEVFKEIIIFKDNIPPNISIFHPLSGQLYGQATISYELSIIEGNLENTWYSLNGGPNYEFSGLSGNINQAAWDLCGNGTNIVRFYANDSLGNIGYRNVQIQKETHFPNITIISPSSYDVFGKLNFRFELSIEEDYLDKTWYSINGGLNYTCDELSDWISQAAWNLCDNGTIIIRFYANNTAGNMAFEEVIIIKDIAVLAPKVAYAIVIGVEDYPGTDSDLDYCRDDAESIYTLLTATYHFKGTNIIMLLDSDATRSNINNAFNQIRSKISSEDIFFFYFAGHGGVDGDGEFMCPYDSIPYDWSYVYRDDYLDYRLDRLQCAEKYVIVDACNSGGLILETKSSGRLIMTSCGSIQDSLESSSLQHGVFTYYFLESYFEATDMNADGLVTMTDQFLYTYDGTVSYSSRAGYTHHPQCYNGISGETIIYPSLKLGTFITSNENLTYNFYVFGNGLIKTIDVTICSLDGDTTIETFNLKGSNPSYTGFGHYSGILSIDDSYNISSYEILVEIEGNEILSFKEGYGDYDGDGLLDILELRIGLDPEEDDTDSDGLSDFDEYYGTTDPLISDSDSDGLLDGEEVNTYNTNPNSADTDSDGLLDGEEVNTYNTNPNSADTDSDGLLDGEEVNTYNTNPLNWDTDGDSYSDRDEILIHHTDPLDPNSYPRPEPSSPAIPGYNFYIIITFTAIIIVSIKKSKSKSLIK